MTDLAELKALLEGVDLSVCNSSWLGNHVRTALPELIKELDKARSGADELRAALWLILPMAKGYAATHDVGSNANYIATAEAALAKHPSKSTAIEALDEMGQRK